MRLDYIPNPPKDLPPEEQQIVERVKARRGAKGLIPLDLTLLHSPKVADGKWFLSMWHTAAYCFREWSLTKVARLERSSWSRPNWNLLD